MKPIFLTELRILGSNAIIILNLITQKASLNAIKITINLICQYFVNLDLI
jgi:hypothetical protein